MEKTMNQKISQALLILRPGAQWTLRGDDYANLEWLDTEQTPPTWTEVQTEINKPEVEPTIEDKLASVGFKLSDLKSALGL